MEQFQNGLVTKNEEYRPAAPRLALGVLSLVDQLRILTMRLRIRYYRSRGDIRNEVRAHRKMGCLFEARGHFDEALGCFEKSSSSRDLVRVYLARGDFLEAGHQYRELRAYYLAGDAYSAAEEWILAARSYRQSGRFLEAVRCWERWLETDALHQMEEEHASKVMTEIAFCHDRLGRLKEAAKLYRAALQRLDSMAAKSERQGSLQKSRRIYLAIAHIGHCKGTYESIACGLIWAMRVARFSAEPEHRVLGYYDDFIHYAKRFREYASAAEMALEAANYCSDSGQRRLYLQMAGENWLLEGDFSYVHLDRRKLAEHSFYEAMECLLRAGASETLPECYLRLSVVAQRASRDEFKRLLRENEDRERGRLRRNSDPFALLSISPSDGPEQVQSAYFSALRRSPPDTSFQRFESLRLAFEVLSDSDMRKRYLKLIQGSG